MRKKVWIYFQEGGTPDFCTLVRHHYLAEEMSKEYDVTLFIMNNGHLFTKEVDSSMIEKLPYKFVMFNLFKSVGSTSFKRVLTWLLFPMQLFFYGIVNRGKVDTIIVSSMPIFQIFPAVLLKIFGKVGKVVFEIRDIWPLTGVLIGGYSRYNPLILFMKFAEWFGHKFSNSIVSVLPNYSLYLKEDYRFALNKYSYIPNGVSLDFYLNNSGDIENSAISLPNFRGKFVVGYCGSIGVSNNMMPLLETAKLLQSQKDIVFIIVGHGPSLRELVDFSTGNNLHNVYFFNKIEKRYVISLVSKFNVGYVGSKDEEIYNYGISANKIFDYMYAGVPVLISSSTKDNIIEQASCGFTVQPDDIVALKDTINDLYRMDASKLVDFGKNGNKIILDFFNYKNISSLYIKLIS